jgi:hypothetical protein
MQSILRFLWEKAAIGSTKFSTTNGVDYYASLFAFELVAFSMCVRIFAFRRMKSAATLTYCRLLLGVVLTFQQESGSIEIADRNQTAKWIAYSFLQFVFMYVPNRLIVRLSFSPSYFPQRLFGRGIYIKRSSSLHLVLHILQVVAWFPIALMCLSDDCSGVDSFGGLGAAWNYVFLFVKCSCATSCVA